MNYSKHIKDLVIINILIRVETEIIKLRTKNLENNEIDKVLTQLQDIVHKMKPYNKKHFTQPGGRTGGWGKSIKWDKINLNPLHEFVT